MHPRATQLISSLGLLPHPEGGHFREMYRSPDRVQPLDDQRPARAALTTIYFLLAAGEVSRWHRVRSDEIWHFYEGDPLELLTASDGFAAITRHTLGPVGADARPVRVAPADVWQAARSTGAYTLVGCTVGPGFDFADFRLLRDEPAAAERLRQRQPDVAQFV